MTEMIRLSNTQLLMVTAAMVKWLVVDLVLSKDTIRLNRDFNRDVEAKRIRSKFAQKAANMILTRFIGIRS